MSRRRLMGYKTNTLSISQCFEAHVKMCSLPVVIWQYHYNDVIMGAMASQITSPKIAYSSVYSGADQRKHQSSASLAFVRGIHWWPVNSPHKGPLARKMFPFDDVIMWQGTRKAEPGDKIIFLHLHAAPNLSHWFHYGVICICRGIYNHMHLSSINFIYLMYIHFTRCDNDIPIYLFQI